MVTLLVAVAAGLGAVARFLADRTISHRVRSERPYGTFAVNVSGSLLLGLVVGLTLHAGLSSAPAAVAGAGFLGGYTTLSTWAYESFALHEDGDSRGAAVNVVASVAVGMAGRGRRRARARVALTGT